jgi:hypothetical protein
VVDSGQKPAIAGDSSQVDWAAADAILHDRLECRVTGDAQFRKLISGTQFLEQQRHAVSKGGDPPVARLITKPDQAPAHRRNPARGIRGNSFGSEIRSLNTRT